MPNNESMCQSVSIMFTSSRDSTSWGDRHGGTERTLEHYSRSVAGFSFRARKTWDFSSGGPAWASRSCPSRRGGRWNTDRRDQLLDRQAVESLSPLSTLELSTLRRANREQVVQFDDRSSSGGSRLRRGCRHRFAATQSWSRASEESRPSSEHAELEGKRSVDWTGRPRFLEYDLSVRVPERHPPHVLRAALADLALFAGSACWMWAADVVALRSSSRLEAPRWSRST